MWQILSHSLLILWFIMVSPVSYSDNSIYTITYPEALQQRLISALNNKGSEYKARTRHVNNGQPVYTNRLIFADSPYLLQHAHNPVNWYTWGEEAFAAAKRENKPVFLSIGYATCHWCHVMEEESFESIDVAKILNEHFISIKVDREQHPDIDATYMTAVTLLTGRGGWPMSSFITHEGKPFFGGTYYPQTTFINLLMQVKSAWDRQHQTILTQANQLAEAVEKETSRQGAVATLEQSAVQSAIQQTLSRYDSQNGGFSSAPKFPNEPLLILLLQAAERHKNPPLLEAL
ncbi:MAG: thioredoxin domain-containing protein, partial [Methylococcales bacterium]|nr:thioredoxin domain-containing protein [Methylococcales bacterium]